MWIDSTDCRNASPRPRVLVRSIQRGTRKAEGHLPGGRKAAARWHGKEMAGGANHRQGKPRAGGLRRLLGENGTFGELWRVMMMVMCAALGMRRVGPSSLEVRTFPPHPGQPGKAERHAHRMPIPACEHLIWGASSVSCVRISTPLLA